MKKLIVMTALAASIAVSATAKPKSPINLREIQYYAPNADVSTLTNIEILVLLNIIHGSGTEGEKRLFVQNFMRKKKSSLPKIPNK